MTIIAKNTLSDPFEYPLYFEVVLKVTVVNIDDFQIITSKEQEKSFQVSFDSLGTNACLVVDFGDGTVKSYGDELYCKEWQPGVKYDPTFEQLTNPLDFKYIY